jgi:DNA-binding IclR family transcriptional regulator
MAVDRIEEKLDTIIELLKHVLAVNLARGGVPQAKIAKRVRLATATVNKMLQGIKKERPERSSG